MQAVQRRHLQEATVVGQLDKKFIIAQAAGLLFIVDQHAADERVRLERLQHQVHCSHEMCSLYSLEVFLVASRCTPPPHVRRCCYAQYGSDDSMCEDSM